MIFFIFSTLFVISDCARILGLTPIPYRSHHILFEAYFEGLADRGHEVIVITPFPTNSGKYAEIDVSQCYSSSTGIMHVEDMLKIMESPPLIIYHAYREEFSLDTAILKCPSMLEFLRGDLRFDLVVIELFASSYALLPIVEKIGAPFISLCSTFMPPWTGEHVGAPLNPSYITTLFNSLTDDLDSFQARLYNTYNYIVSSMGFHTVLLPSSHAIAQSRFKNVSSLMDIANNVSLMLSFTNVVFNEPRPLPPAVVEVGGLHIKAPKKLPKEIENFLNESPHGVIYFSMGSLLNAATLSNDKRDAFISTFSKLPLKVLWKWDRDLPSNATNIMTLPWMPQRDILAHPKVKLFISHGGGLGMSEALTEGVPVLGIPIFADQRANINRVRKQGGGEFLNYEDIGEESLERKILQIINNSSYGENMKKLSRAYKDRPIPPLELATYWTEYVIRHEGARHLRSASVGMPLYQYLLVDVVAFLLLTAAAVIAFVYKVVKSLFLFLRRDKKGKKIKSS